MLVLGDKELVRAIDQLEARARKKVLQSSTRFAMTPWQKQAAANAPVDTGTLRLSLQRPKAKRVKNYPRLGEVVGWVGPAAGFSSTIRGRLRRPIKYAHLVEFGSAAHTIEVRNAKVLGDRTQNFGTRVQHPGMAAKPFLRPAFRSKWRMVRDRFGQKAFRDIAKIMRQHTRK